MPKKILQNYPSLSVKSTALLLSFGYYERVRSEKDQERKKKVKMVIASTRGLRFR